MKEKKSLICRGKECMVDHIKKHKKIYLWSAIIAWGIILVKIILIVSLASMSLEKTDKIWGQEEETLFLFYQIEDIAHQRELIIHDLGTWYAMPQEEKFHNLEKQFHLTQDLYEKIQIAKKLKEIIDLQDKYLKEIGYHDPTWSQQLYEIEKKINKLP